MAYEIPLRCPNCGSLHLRELHWLELDQPLFCVCGAAIRLQGAERNIARIRAHAQKLEVETEKLQKKLQLQA